jgi:hypothetical protein
VLLTVAHGQQVRFPAGEQDVPLEYSTHQYLLDHGARPVNENAAKAIDSERERQQAELATREREKANAKSKDDASTASKVKPVSK